MLPVPINDSNLQRFVGRLMAESLLPSALPHNPRLPVDGQILQIDKLIVEGYEALRCHHNCRVHQLRNQGDVIYGWNLYAGLVYGDMTYVAQHHAVWKINGDYFDVTPEYDPQVRHIKKITFLADNRLAIGHGVTISCPSLFIHVLAENLWAWSTGISEHSRFSPRYFETSGVSSDFAITALNLTPP